jgi:hypothetical protein
MRCCFINCCINGHCICFEQGVNSMLCEEIHNDSSFLAVPACCGSCREATVEIPFQFKLLHPWNCPFLEFLDSKFCRAIISAS